ncbi:MAG: lysylphosphatidylglycerol synthase domain-containing protein, partial [Anaerolineales bacterium]
HWSGLESAARVAGEAEAAVVDFCRRSPIGLGYGLLFSALSWAVLLGEYGLMLTFLGIPPDWTGTVAALTAGRLAMLVPLPGALGALEASQVLAVSALGYRPAQGAGLALLIRARDVLFGVTGLALGAWLARRSQVPNRPV